MIILRRTAYIVAIVLCVNIAAWALVNRGILEQPWGGVINGISYSGYREGDTANRLSDADIERDMALLSGHVTSVRVYGVGDGLDRTVPAAARHNLNVTLGAWISRDNAANAQEVAHAVDLVHQNQNIK